VVVGVVCETLTAPHHASERASARAYTVLLIDTWVIQRALTVLLVAVCPSLQLRYFNFSYTFNYVPSC
jgi:hypothetical protein